MSDFHRIQLKKTDSTMRVARENSISHDFCLVSTEIQTAGRGSQGRIWLCEPGNLFMTFSAHHKFLRRDYPLSLLAGVVLHRCLIKYLLSDFRDDMFLKWPNDLLIRQKKVSGVLIESSNSHYHIGIGINTRVAPDISDGGRQSISLAEVSKPLPANSIILEELGRQLQKIITHCPAQGGLIAQWSSLCDWSLPVHLRSRPDIPLRALCLNEQGLLKVEHPDKSVQTLNAEYLI